MPGCWGWLGSLGLEPKRLSDVDEERGAEDILVVVEKAVADEAVSRRVAMLAVFMVVCFSVSLMLSICFFEAVDEMHHREGGEGEVLLCHLEGGNL